MSKYRRLTWIDRLRIEKLYNSGSTYRAIASALGRSVSCIHREVKRGLYDHLDGATWLTVKRYSAQIAQENRTTLPMAVPWPSAIIMPTPTLSLTVFSMGNPLTPSLAV